jgi:hypothetical protein
MESFAFFFNDLVAVVPYAGLESLLIAVSVRDNEETTSL